MPVRRDTKSLVLDSHARHSPGETGQKRQNVDQIRTATGGQAIRGDESGPTDFHPVIAGADHTGQADLGFEIAKKNGRDGVQLTKLADGQKVDDEFKFLPGTSMTKNMLRVFYEWPVMTDYMPLQLSNLNDTDTLHFASAIWQNEPFND